MDDPLAEIATAIDRCAAAPSPDDQAAAFKHYFVPDSTFSHPLCYVGRSADSRSIITEIYFFYRSVIPETSFEVVAKAWDPEALHLFVRLIQRPKFLIVGRFWVPELPMLIHFTLVRREDDGKFLIRDLEDLIQPRVSWSSSIIPIDQTRHDADKRITERSVVFPSPLLVRCRILLSLPDDGAT